MSQSREIRLQKYIADCGVTSRRKAEQLMVEGKVKVNGQIVYQLGSKIDPEEDAVEVDGQLIDQKTVSKMYIVMNKPRGYVTTLNDPEGRRTVMDLVKDVPERIYPVGRLDYLSEGLLILTNDGDLANKILHPRYNMTKIYEVKVFGAVNDRILKELRKERMLEDGKVKPQSVRVIKQLAKKTWLEFRLTEGRNREIRKICEACGLTVDKLKRIAIEGLSVEGITPGGYRLVPKHILMKFLNLTTEGKRTSRPLEYQSSKRTINIKKRVQRTTSADDKIFQMYRRETYFETIKQIETSKEIKRQKEIEERKKLREKKSAPNPLKDLISSQTSRDSYDL